MKSTENLVAANAVEKMREIVGAAPTCFFACALSKVPFHLCPMDAQEVDDRGCIWFFSGVASTHHAHLQDDRRVELMFCNGGKQESLAVYGHATVASTTTRSTSCGGRWSKHGFPRGRTIRILP
jgi:general stress protein 26